MPTTDPLSLLEKGNSYCYSKKKDNKLDYTCLKKDTILQLVNIYNTIFCENNQEFCLENKIINIKNRIDKYTNKIKICNLFYFMDTIKKYEKKMNTSNKYNKYLSNDEKRYIINFVDRTNLYLNYLENSLNKLNNLKSTQEYNKYNYIIQLNKIILELKKKFNKFTILNNIDVK